ncbi:MAG TPA: prepilin-type N-terminal cleavage/methylation domain-containing protein [Mycobacteriales bacterium]|nr:prepilin-type N-terminal cleavage/methylation domain-containing protein [Mycobacteriales bacterium]
MLARLRKMQEENEGGFTLIELLVVIIIIGILAAIAIPVFLQQRKKGYDAAVKSDLVAAATAEETYLTDFNTYTDSTSNLATKESFKFSAGGDYNGGTAALTIVSNTNQGYCITGVAASGNTWFYDSSAGGVQPAASSYTCGVSGAS